MIKSIDNCLGFEDSINLNQPSLVESLCNDKIIDVACGENFTVILKNENFAPFYTSRTMKTFKSTHFSNIKEKIKNYREYTHYLRLSSGHIKPINKSKIKMILSPKKKTSIPKDFIEKDTERLNTSISNKKSSSIMVKRQNFEISNENQLLNEEAKKYSIVLENTFKITKEPTNKLRTKSEHIEKKPLIPIVIYDKVAQHINKKEIDSKYISIATNKNYNPEFGMYKSEEDKIMEKFAQVDSVKKNNNSNSNVNIIHNFI